MPWNIKVVLFATLLIFLYLLFSKTAERIRKKYPHGLTFLLGLFATYFGVVAGLDMTIEFNRSKERKTVIQLLEASIEENETLQMKILGQYVGVYHTYFGASTVPLQQPLLFSKILRDERVVNTISVRTYSKLMLEENFLGFYNDQLLTSFNREPDSTLQSIVGGYGKNLYFIANLLKVEVFHLSGDIDENELIGMHEYFDSLYKGVDHHEIIARTDLAAKYNLVWNHPFSPENIITGDSLPTGNK